jgi:hypothetical protein
MVVMTAGSIWGQLRSAADPAIRRLAGDASADVMTSPLVRTLVEFPTDVHPYKKWWGTHWRLVELADLALPRGVADLSQGVDHELAWLTSQRHRAGVRWVAGKARRCASQEGNAVYACAALGFARDPRVSELVTSLVHWQWPDGGWNCDVRPVARRSSFHETVTPALGLATYAAITGDEQARSAARRAADLLLEHRMFRALRTGEVVHPSWTKLHYPAYWHYDLLQGLRLLRALDLLDDPRAAEALDLVARARRNDGRFSGPAWWSAAQPDAVDWGRGTGNDMLNLQAAMVLRAAGRSV